MHRYPHRHLRGRDRHLVVGVLVLCFLTAAAASGCGGSLGADPQAGAPLIDGSADPPLGTAQISRARRAALAFARSYAASVGGGAGLRDATPALAAELAANRARLPDAGRLARLRLRTLVLSPRSARSVEATASFAAGREAPFPIVFDLRRSGGGWLAVGLPGN
jgi:hypothetical protein